MLSNARKNNDTTDVDDDILKPAWEIKDVHSTDKSKVLTEFPTWVSSIKNLNLSARTGELWRYLKDGSVSTMDKAMIVAALLYCLSPIDIVPDHIPLAGLLDDLSVVLRVLAGIAVDAKVNKRKS